MQQKNGNLSRVSVFYFGKEREKCARGHARIPLPGGGRFMCARRCAGNNSAGDHWSPLLRVIRKDLNCFPLRTISSREARPVIAAKANMPFFIERNSSVQSGGFLRAKALKFPFFLVPFSFGNERKRNSARRADTARLRAIAKERYSRHAPSEHTRCYVNGICC